MSTYDLVPLHTLLTTVTPPYGDSWEECFNGLLEDAHETRRVVELMEEIEVGGLDSLTPGTVRWWEQEEEDDDPTGWSYANGTHRLLAAIQLGHESFPVRYLGPNHETPQEETPYRYTELTICLNLKEGENGREQREIITDCLASSSSFRLSEDVWVESDFQSSTSNRTWTEFNVMFTSVPDHLVPVLVAKFKERTSCCVPWNKADSLQVKQVFDYFDLDALE